MLSRLQCDICGSRSAPVSDPNHLTAGETQALREFTAEHDACTQGDHIVYPHGAVSPEVHPEVMRRAQGGPFGSPKGTPRATRRPHGYFEATGPYGDGFESVEGKSKAVSNG